MLACFTFIGSVCVCVPIPNNSAYVCVCLDYPFVFIVSFHHIYVDVIAKQSILSFEKYVWIMNINNNIEGCGFQSIDD